MYDTNNNIAAMSLPFKSFRTHFVILVFCEILVAVLIILSVVVEHMIDPWRVIRQLSRLLSREGLLIASIPNIIHWRVLKDLILFDKWEYQEAGILNKGHFRFFTPKAILSMFNQSGFTVKSIHPVISEKAGAKLLNLLTLGIFKKLLTWCYLIKAQKDR
jgi:hypothetical protein